MTDRLRLAIAPLRAAASPRLAWPWRRSDAADESSAGLLLDGHEVRIVINRDLVTAFDHGLGMSPFDVLIPTNTLAATAQPHVARLARCSCGDYGCRPTSATIRRLDNTVRWDWHDVAPMTRPAVFEADAYDAEVARIEADETWQRPQDTVARRCFERIDRDVLASHGLVLTWISPDEEDPEHLTFSFDTLLAADGVPEYQIFVDLPWQGRNPNDVADDAATLVQAPPATWRASWWACRVDNDAPPAIAGPDWRPADRW